MSRIIPFYTSKQRFKPIDRRVYQDERGCDRVETFRKMSDVEERAAKDVARTVSERPKRG